MSAEYTDWARKHIPADWFASRRKGKPMADQDRWILMEFGRAAFEQGIQSMKPNKIERAEQAVMRAMAEGSKPAIEKSGWVSWTPAIKNGATIVELAMCEPEHIKRALYSLGVESP